MRISSITVNEPTREIEVESDETMELRTLPDYLDRFYPKWTSAVVVLTRGRR